MRPDHWRSSGRQHHIHRGGLLSLLVVCVLVTACAARSPSRQLLAEMSKADVLLREGCYRCLIDALVVYERVAAQPRAPVNARRGAFNAALLLAMRAKELGLPSAEHLARARSLSEALPTSSQPAVPPAAYLAAAELFVGETSGLDPEKRQQLVRARREKFGDPRQTAPARADIAPATATDFVAEYLALAIDCEDVQTRQNVKADVLLTRHAGVPLMLFRVAICGFRSVSLADLRERDPRWVDTLFTEGQREMATRPVADAAKAAELFASARAAFPASHAITMALGTTLNALSEHEAALENFDAVLRDEPSHLDALLGRVVSLSYMSRHTDAIASATRMIELGTWHQGDAFYWRSWNRYHLYQLDLAWSDIERATSLQVNTSVYYLAGVIAYARKELDTAIERFDRSFAMDNTNCEAVWSAGLVHVDQQAWTSAAPKFSRAMSCFVANADQLRREIADLEKVTYAEAVKARRLATAQKRVETAEHRKAQSAFNAAQSYLRLNQKGPALSHADVAAEHPLLKEKAVALRASIEKLPNE